MTVGHPGHSGFKVCLIFWFYCRVLSFAGPSAIGQHVEEDRNIEDYAGKFYGSGWKLDTSFGHTLGDSPISSLILSTVELFC